MDNITVRDAAIKDAGRLLEIYSYYVQHTAITFEYDVPTLSDFQNRIKNTKKKYPYIVIERMGQFRDRSCQWSSHKHRPGLYEKLYR